MFRGFRETNLIIIMSLLSFTKKLGAKKAVKKKPAEKTEAAEMKTPVKKKKTGSKSLLIKQIKLMPIVTEKSVEMQTHGVAVFRVDVGVNKGQIREAIEVKYGVKVQGVRTIRMVPKSRRRGNTRGRTNNWKKALVKVDDVQSLVSGP